MTEAPPLYALHRLHPTLISTELLAQIAAANWNDRLTTEDLTKEVLEQRISAWGVNNTPAGLALLRIEQSPSRRVLILDGLAGHNVLKHGRAIVKDLETIARFWGASTMEASARDPRWQTVTRRLGFAPVATVYERKIV